MSTGPCRLRWLLWPRARLALRLRAPSVHRALAANGVVRALATPRQSLMELAHADEHGGGGRWPVDGEAPRQNQNCVLPMASFRKEKKKTHVLTKRNPAFAKHNFLPLSRVVIFSLLKPLVCHLFVFVATQNQSCLCRAKSKISNSPTKYLIF